MMNEGMGGAESTEVVSCKKTRLEDVVDNSIKRSVLSKGVVQGGQTKGSSEKLGVGG